MSIRFKSALKIIATHYGVDTMIARKLCKLFPHEGRKDLAILVEAERIVSLRERLNHVCNQCKLCGLIAPTRIVKARPDLNLTIKPRAGWTARNINSPVLCKNCWHQAMPVVYAYQQLLDLYRMCNQLSRAQHEQ